MSLLLGCIADDITGASDLALMLANNGMSVTQYLDTPEKHDEIETDAVVFGLKIRTSVVEQAIQEATKAAQWLMSKGAKQFYYKYCSTFDSTTEGNIGPVTDCLLQLLDERFTLVCPTFPENGRTVNEGRLYVDGKLLSESSMRHHPLTPMTDSNLLALMDAQTRPDSSGLVSLSDVRKGSDYIGFRFTELEREGVRYAVVDAETDSDLRLIGRSVKHLRLVTGGSGLAMGLPANFELSPDDSIHHGCEPLPVLEGHPVVLAGSCSVATSKQVEMMKAHHPSIQIDPVSLSEGSQTTDGILEDLLKRWERGPVLVYSASRQDDINRAQSLLGRSRSAMLIEDTFGELAGSLASRGASKFIVAGGETSGAVSRALGLKALRTGPQIDSGVPWMIRKGDEPLAIAFKSGNFGKKDFFLRAMEMLK